MSVKVWTAIFGIFLAVGFSFHVAAGEKFMLRQMTVACGDAVLNVDGTVTKNISCLITDNNMAMVSLRQLADALDKDALWDPATKSIKIQSIPKVAKQKTDNNFTWLEDVKVLRNVGPFYQQKNRSFMLAAGSHSRGVAVNLDEKETADVVIRTDGQFRGLEGWLGVEDSSMNSSGGFILSVFSEEKKIFESPNVIPGAFPIYLSTKDADITGAKTVRLQVKWTDSGFTGDQAGIDAVLADFKLIR